MRRMGADTVAALHVQNFARASANPQPGHITRHGIPLTTQLSLAVDLQLPIPSPGAPKQAQAGFPRPPAAHALR